MRKHGATKQIAIVLFLIILCQHCTYVARHTLNLKFSCNMLSCIFSVQREQLI
jgi:hypothetical protein